MTSGQLMQTGHDISRRAMLACLMCIQMIVVAGCTTLQQPRELASPYQYMRIWAVVPPLNESGVSEVDSNRFADMLAQEAQQVAGIDVLPVNRVLQAMHDLRMTRVNTPADAVTLMNTLAVDGLMVGNITAYDPYPPPLIAAAVQLYERPPLRSWDGSDVRDLVQSSTDVEGLDQLAPARPVAQAAGVFDAQNHRTIFQLQQYAKGRSVPDSAYGEEIYLTSIELYTRFVSYRLINDLLYEEQLRISQAALEQSEARSGP